MRFVLATDGLTCAGKLNGALASGAVVLQPASVFSQCACLSHRPVCIVSLCPLPLAYLLRALEQRCVTGSIELNARRL